MHTIPGSDGDVSPLEIKCQDGLIYILMGKLVHLLSTVGHPLHLCSHPAVPELMHISSSMADFQEEPMFLGASIVKSCGLTLNQVLVPTV